MPLRTIIVEDEPLSREFLCNLLKEFHPAIEVIVKVATENDAVAAIVKYAPDLLFLDIELQQGTGFGVLRKIKCHDLQVVFTTAFDHYAIKAIQFSGVEYLHKPIDLEGLEQVIQKVVDKKESGAGKIALEHLLCTLENNNVPDELFLPASDGNQYVTIANISRIESNEGTCIFRLCSGETISVSNNLKEYEAMLSDHHFFRPHSAHIINLKQVNRLEGGETSQLIMKDNSIVPVSPKKKEEIQAILLKQV